MKNFRNEEGFTLVELMVVVAVIGILSSVAIPNFKRYQAKSKSSEAKLQLSAIYSALTSLQADYDSFGTCLKDAGYTAPTNNYYAVGFANDATANANQIVVDNGGVCDDDQHQFAAQKKVGGKLALTASAVENVTAAQLDNGSNPLDNSTSSSPIGTAGVDSTGSYFVAVAVGNIDPDFTKATVGDDNEQSKWGINEDKNLKEISRGY